jgi:uncharacterized membrane protein YgcG
VTIGSRRPDDVGKAQRTVAEPHRRTAAVALTALLLVAVAALGAAPPVIAQSVPKLAAQVTDDAGALSGGRGDLDAALTRLQDAGVQLWVAFVHTTGSDTPGDFAKATFEQNGLGGNDMLLVVAVDDHRYAWWEQGAVSSLSSSTIDADASRTLEPRFRAGDYAGGVADFADAIRTDLASGGKPGGDGSGGTSGDGSGIGSAVSDAVSRVVALALLAIGIVALLLVGIVVFRRWRNVRLTAEERDRRTGELARRANAGLIAADDAVREATQDLGFAEAQFEDADVAPLRGAIAAAKTELSAAFAVRQKLDDEIPEDPPTREAMLGEIVDRTDRAVAGLDAERKRIQGLREAEQQAPRILDELPARVAALEARLPAAEATLTRLRAFAAGSLAAVAGNAVEARKRLADSTAEVERGRAALAASPPDTHAAGRSVRRVTGAIAEAGALLDAIDRTAAALDDARGRVDREIADAAADLEKARAAAGSSPEPAVRDHLTEAATLLDRARAAATAPQPDVLAAVQAAQGANTAADRILAGIREVEAQRTREAAALRASLQTAETLVAQASDYITTRRSGVGREARTRLAEAERHLESARALAATDAAGAKSEADTAARMANEAYDLARSDFDGGDGRGGGGSDLGKLILGGIILGNVLGGGRHGGGWGGTPWGMPGGGGGWGGGGWGGGGFGGGRGGGGGWGGGGFGGGGGGGGRGGGGGW